MTYSLSFFMLLFIVPCLISGTITLVFALLGWRHRNITISLPFTLLMAALTIWFYGYVLELLSPDLPMSLVFNHIEVPFTLVVPVAFLLLVLYYTGHETFVTKKNVLLLFIVPVIITLLEFSNPFHYQYYTRFYPVPSDGMVVWMHDYGPFFWLGAAYTYSLIALSLVLIIAGLIGTGRHQRHSLYLLLIASAAPVAMNLLFIFRIISPRSLDLTPFAFLVTGLILAFVVVLAIPVGLIALGLISGHGAVPEPCSYCGMISNDYAPATRTGPDCPYLCK